MRTIFNLDAQDICLQFSRQTTKSTTVAALTATHSCTTPGYRTMYIAPTVEQARVWSHDRIAPFLEGSPWIKKHYLSSSLIQNVWTKQLLNQSKIFIRYALLTADRLRGYSFDHMLVDECYSKNTEVLTNVGWKLFKELNQTELIATVNPNTREVEYHKPYKYISRHYRGKLIDFKHRSFKLQVTPNHIMHINQKLNTGWYRQKEDEWFEQTAGEVVNKDFRIGCKANWKDKVQNEFVLPEKISFINAEGSPYKHKANGRLLSEFRTSMQAFMKFMGWYLSEGSLQKNTIQIVQSKQENLESIKDCLTQLGVEWFEYTSSKTGCHSFRFSNANLVTYLRQFGLSKDKYISRDLLDQKKYLLDLLKTLYDGDGIHRPGDINSYGELKTISKKLADTVQEAWLRLGVRATIRQTIQKSGKHGIVNVKQDTLSYLVRPLISPDMIFWSNNTNKAKISEIDYDDKVYCVSVQNHLIFVRDKVEKTPVICGNCQDMVLDLIPVIEQGMSRSYFKRRIFTGTPKLSRGTLAHYWNNSTKNEWFVKCPGCSKYNYLDEQNIGKNGIICRFCGGYMDPRNGTWVRTGDSVSPVEGFRVCALQFAGAPWVDWNKDIIWKYETESRGIFFNEVLGLAYDPGVTPITEDEVKACCTGGPMIQNMTDEIQAEGPIYIGVDYGPASSERSFTVLVALQPQDNGQTRVLFCKKYSGKEADFHHIHTDVPHQFRRFNARLIGADYGLGEASNSEIRSHIGETKLVPFFHSTQKERLKYNNKIGVYTTARLRVMTEFFSKIKHKKFIFPCWEEFEPFAEDILAIVIEYSLDNTKIKYVNSEPDDSLHAILYADLLAELDMPSRIVFSHEFEDPNAGLY